LAGEAAVCCMYMVLAMIPLFVFLVAVVVGRLIESNHLKDLARREQALKGTMVIHTRMRAVSPGMKHQEMMFAEVALGADRFVTWLAMWKQLIGGNLGSLEPVVDRARREALLRIAEQSAAKGYTELANVRFSTASMKVGDRRQKELILGIFAFGTAFGP